MKFLKPANQLTIVATILICLDAFSSSGDLCSQEVVTEIVEIPASRIEFITREPSNEHVWIKGSWERQGGEWEWVPGQWLKPPTASARWVKGHWNLQGGKWTWKKASWIANSEEGYIVEKIVNVPRPLVENIKEKVANMDYWIPGGWEWNGRWVWGKGHWAKKPGESVAWVPGHWDDYGSAGFRWTPGHWVQRN